MKSKKQKTFSDKIKGLRGKPGTIELTDKDRNEFVRGIDDAIMKESKEMENFVWLIAGVAVGILGNFIVMLFYDWLKSLENWQFVSLSVGSILLFFMLVLFFIYKLLDHRSNIKNSIWSRKMWKRAKNVKVGLPVKMYEEDELEELKRDLTKKK